MSDISGVITPDTPITREVINACFPGHDQRVTAKSMLSKIIDLLTWVHGRDGDIPPPLDVLLRLDLTEAPNCDTFTAKTLLAIASLGELNQVLQSADANDIWIGEAWSTQDYEAMMILAEALQERLEKLKLVRG